MTAWADRPKNYHVHGTDALRATKTPALSELFLVTSGGVPTGELYVGDGATAGGIIVARDAAYALLDGSRPFTGHVTFSSLITVNGAALFTDLTTLTSVQIVALAPLLTLFNFTEEDSDGGRESWVRFGGETAAGALHYLASLRVDHVGSGADQKSRARLFMNDGDDGLGNGQLMLTLTGEDLLADWAAEVRTPVGRLASYRRGASLGSIGTSYVAIPWTAVGREDTGFALNTGGNSTEVTLAFDGDLLVDYSLTLDVEDNTTSRAESTVRLEIDTGSGFAAVAGSSSGGYHRKQLADSVNGQACCAMSGVLVPVSSGDKLRLVAKRSRGNAVDLQVVTECARLTMRRLQGAA